MPSASPTTDTKVTAVMITGKDRRRYAMARVAIACFLKQNYTNRELLVINDGEESVGVTDERVREVRLPSEPKRPLGALRNMAFDMADGEWLIQWDDDDWHAPERIAVQMAHRPAGPGGAVLLCRQVRYNLARRSGFVHRVRTGIEGTILHARGITFRYPEWNRSEDGEFLKGFPAPVLLQNDPLLYVRMYSGLNTWSERHIMRRLAKMENERFMLKRRWRFLQEQVVPAYQDLSFLTELN